MFLCHPGDVVYCRSPKHSWVLGSILEVGLTATAVTVDQERGLTGETISGLPSRDVLSLNSSQLHEEVEDMTLLTVLHEATVLRSLFLRQRRNLVYARVGPSIMLSLNPYSATLFTPELQQQHLAASSVSITSGKNVPEELSPHLWDVAFTADRNLHRNSKNEAQFIVPLGESGSGKTEAVKLCVDYLFALAAERQTTKSEKEKCDQFRKVIATAAVVLSAFGNARTIKSDNSSRFSKILQIFYSTSGSIQGVKTSYFFLEKSRVCCASFHERLFHSFYLLFRSQSFSQRFSLADEKSYVSVSSGQMWNNPQYDSEDSFEEVVQGMKNELRMSSAETVSFWSVVAAILNLQNIRFVEDRKKEGEGSGDKEERPAIVSPETVEYLNAAARLLGISDPRLLEQHLLGEDISTLSPMQQQEISNLGGGGGAFIPYSCYKAADVRDSFSMTLYSALFEDIIQRCNQITSANRSVDASQSSSSGWIGLVDIFGFEDCAKNDFEQFCINTTNEVLQSCYNSTVFEKDIEECRKEQVAFASNLKVPDCQSCVDLLCGDVDGILSMLDDHTAKKNNDNNVFFEEIKAAHFSHPNFEQYRFAGNKFSVSHSAGTVKYNADGWLEKNRADRLPVGLWMLIRNTTTDQTIRKIVSGDTVGPFIPRKKEGLISLLDTQSGEITSVTEKFNGELKSLLQLINSSKAHWIRCIKGHPTRRRGLFDGVSVASQVQVASVVEAAKLVRSGFPHRVEFREFADRYMLSQGIAAYLNYLQLKNSGQCDAVIADPVVVNDDISLEDNSPTTEEKGGSHTGTGCSYKEFSELLLRKTGMYNNTDCILGSTKVFFRTKVLDALEEARLVVFTQLTSLLHRCARGYRVRTVLATNRVVRATHRIASEWRNFIERTEATRRRREKSLDFIMNFALTLSENMLEEMSSVSVLLLETFSNEMTPMKIRFTLEGEERDRDALKRKETEERQRFSSSTRLILETVNEPRARTEIAERERYMRLLVYNECYTVALIHIQRQERSRRSEIFREYQLSLSSKGVSSSSILKASFIGTSSYILNVQALEIEEKRARVRLGAHEANVREVLMLNPFFARRLREVETSEVMGRAALERAAEQEWAMRRKFEHYCLLTKVYLPGTIRTEEEQRTRIAEDEEIFRALLLEVHLREERITLVTSRIASVLQSEKRIRLQIWELEKDNRLFVCDAAKRDHDFLELNTVEVDEAQLRDVIETHFRASAELITVENILGCRMKAVCTVEKNEKEERKAIRKEEKNQCFFRLHFFIWSVELMRAESLLRRHIWLLRCLELYESHGRYAIEKYQIQHYFDVLLEHHNRQTKLVIPQKIEQRMKKEKELRIRRSLERQEAARFASADVEMAKEISRSSQQRESSLSSLSYASPNAMQSAHGRNSNEILVSRPTAATRELSFSPSPSRPSMVRDGFPPSSSLQVGRNSQSTFSVTRGLMEGNCSPYFRGLSRSPTRESAWPN